MTRRTSAFVVVATIAAAMLGTAADAEAQRRGRARKIDGVRFDVHLDAGWHQAFGVGFRVDIPIVPDGFIQRGVEDEFALSVGGEFFFWNWHDHRGRNDYWDYRSDGVAFWPTAMAQWNFYLNESWSIFPELGLGIAFWSYEHEHRDEPRHSHAVVRPFPSISFGARWHFSDRNALLFRINWPAGAQFGITF